MDKINKALFHINFPEDPDISKEVLKRLEQKFPNDDWLETAETLVDEDADPALQLLVAQLRQQIGRSGSN